MVGAVNPYGGEGPDGSADAIAEAGISYRDVAEGLERATAELGDTDGRMQWRSERAAFFKRLQEAEERGVDLRAASDACERRRLAGVVEAEGEWTALREALKAAGFDPETGDDGGTRRRGAKAGQQRDNEAEVRTSWASAQELAQANGIASWSDFIPVNTFRGAVKGFFFGLRGGEVGYHSDKKDPYVRTSIPGYKEGTVVENRATEAERGGDNTQAQQLREAQLRGIHKRDVQDKRRVRPCRKKPRVGQTTVMRSSSTAGDDGELQKGFWTIDSANPNSWTSAEHMGRNSTADVMVVQETKKFGNKANSIRSQAARWGGWAADPWPAAKTECGKPSGGIATMVRGSSTMEPAEHLSGRRAPQGVLHPRVGFL